MTDEVGARACSARCAGLSPRSEPPSTGCGRVASTSQNRMMSDVKGSSRLALLRFLEEVVPALPPGLRTRLCGQLTPCGEARAHVDPA